MGQDRAQQGTRSLSKAGMAWKCCACTRAALAFSSEAEASDVPETSQHKQHDIRHVLPHEQICPSRK